MRSRIARLEALIAPTARRISEAQLARMANRLTTSLQTVAAKCETRGIEPPRVAARTPADLIAALDRIAVQIARAGHIEGKPR